MELGSWCFNQIFFTLNIFQNYFGIFRWVVTYFSICLLYGSFWKQCRGETDPTLKILTETIMKFATFPFSKLSHTFLSQQYIEEEGEVSFLGRCHTQIHNDSHLINMFLDIKDVTIDFNEKHFKIDIIFLQINFILFGWAQNRYLI